MSKRKNILDIIEELGVEVTDGLKQVVDLLIKGGTLNETDISEKLELKINAVRKILYSLSKLGIVFYTKEKHPEKKWWYVYSWTLDADKAFVKYIEFLKKELKEKEESLADTSAYFLCKKCERKIEHADALVGDFKCSRCGRMLKEVKKKDAKLERAIKRLRKEIEEYS